MALVVTDDKHYKNIAEAIRLKGESVMDYTPEEMVAGINEVYGMGYTYGEIAGRNRGYEYGKEDERSSFWGGFQSNGNRTSYPYAFYWLWSDSFYNPAYPLKCTANGGATRMFMYSNITDTKVPITIGSGSSQVFSEMSNLHTIRKLIVSSSTTFSDWFVSLKNLVNIKIEGTIANNGFKISWSTKLSRDSLLSILKALNASVSSITITLPAKCIDGNTDTLAIIQEDTELNSAYTLAISKGYSIAFL